MTRERRLAIPTDDAVDARTDITRERMVTMAGEDADDAAMVW
jgi:hypothetical protein